MKSKKTKNKSVTLDDLAIMVANGFSDQESRFNKRFDGIDERFDRVEDRLDGVEDRLDSLENKVENLDKAIFDLQLRVGSVEDRLKSIEKTLGPLLTVVDIMKDNWKDHDMRISRLEKKMGI